MTGTRKLVYNSGVTRRELIERGKSLGADLATLGFRSHAKIVKGAMELLETEVDIQEVSKETPWPAVAALVDLSNKTAFRLGYQKSFSVDSGRVACFLTQAVLVRGLWLKSATRAVSISVDGEPASEEPLTVKDGFCSLIQVPPKPTIFLACEIDKKGHADQSRRLGIFLTNGSTLGLDCEGTLNAALYGCEPVKG